MMILLWHVFCTLCSIPPLKDPDTEFKSPEMSKVLCQDLNVYGNGQRPERMHRQSEYWGKKISLRTGKDSRWHRWESLCVTEDIRTEDGKARNKEEKFSRTWASEEKRKRWEWKLSESYFKKWTNNCFSAFWLWSSVKMNKHVKSVSNSLDQ